KAASTLTPPLRASRTGAVIGLMAATGMRPAEVLALDRQDVDLDDLVIHVRTGGKRGKQRLIPLHPTVGQVLLDYASLRDGAAAQPATPAFFCSARGARMGRSELNQVFPKLLTQAGIVNRGGRPRPRPFVLGLAFTVLTLIDCYRMGQDVDHKMPILSTYLGHTDPASAYWYLESVPELMHLVADRLENIQGV